MMPLQRRRPFFFNLLFVFLPVSFSSSQSIQSVYHTLSHVFLIFPQFSFGNGLMELARVDLQVQILKSYGVDAYKDPYTTDMLGWMFLSLVLQGILAFILRLLYNKWLMRKIRLASLSRHSTLPKVQVSVGVEITAF